MLIGKQTNIELGDTGSLNVQSVLGGVKFSIMEGSIERASVVLTEDKTRWIIGALCKLTGVQELKGQKHLLMNAPFGG